MKRFLILLIVTPIFCTPVSAQHPAGMALNESLQVTDTLDNCSPVKKEVIKLRAPNIEKRGSELMMSQKEKMKRQVVKLYTCPVHDHLIWEKPGRCPECNTLLNRSAKEQMKMDVMHYSCPRHPHVKGRKGSECDHCGTSLKIRSASNRQDTGEGCVNRSKSGKCRSCGTDPRRSPKEKMKMEVMKVCCCNTK